MIAAALLLQAAAVPVLPPPLTQTPTPEAVALGRRLAERGTLAALLPLAIGKDLTELAAEPKEAMPEQRERIVATGRRVAAERTAQLMDATARAYARHLSLADLHVLIAAAETPAARRKAAADLPAIAETVQAIGSVDLKKEVAKAVCTEQALLCHR